MGNAISQASKMFHADFDARVQGDGGGPVVLISDGRADR